MIVRRNAYLSAWCECVFRDVVCEGEKMNKALLIASLVVAITNIFGMPSDRNSRKRSPCLSETIDRENCSNKKAKTNKNIIEVNANNRAQLIDILEEERCKTEQKKERSKTVYHLTEKLLDKADDYGRYRLGQRLEEISHITNATSYEIHELNQVIQFIQENPSSNLEIPLTFGKAQSNIGDEKFLKVINEAFGVHLVDRKEGESLVWEALNAFEPHKKGKNILFWNGKAYVSGLFSYVPDLRIGNRIYHVIKLYEILGYKEIVALESIPAGFPFLKKSMNWFSIKNFWEEARKQEDSEMSETLQKHKGLCKQYFHEYLEWAAEYIKSSRNLGINTKNLNLSSEGLLKPYKKAEKVMREFLEKFSNYIGEFNKEDQKRFIEDMNNTKNLLYAPSLFDDYGKYWHTEYMVRYLQKYNKPIYGISYYDMCRQCEMLFAESTREELGKDNTIIISGYDYKMSRSQAHPYILSNKSFLQVQLR